MFVALNILSAKSLGLFAPLSEHHRCNISEYLLMSLTAKSVFLISYDLLKAILLITSSASRSPWLAVEI